MQLEELEAAVEGGTIDTVVVAFSGHGILHQTDRPHFYLLPHDLGGASSAGELAARTRAQLAAATTL